MTPEKIKAKELVNSFRMVLMNEDTECGNEILCTSIAKQCAVIAVERNIDKFTKVVNNMEYFSNESRQVIYELIDEEEEIKQEINNL